MKAITLFSLLGVLPLSLTSQTLIQDNFPTKDGLIEYQEVVTVESASSEQLYLNAKKWIATAFKSSDAVIQADDKTGGLIIVKSYIAKGHNNFVSNPKNWFILTIELKEGRYRYTLNQIRYEFDVTISGITTHFDEPFEQWMKDPDENMGAKKRQKAVAALTEYCKELDAEFKNVIASLNSGMEKVEAEDDW